MPSGIYTRTKKAKLNMSLARKGRFAGNEHPRWKGELVGYNALHRRVENILGKPVTCENCETTESKRYEWANISGEYKTDITDWVRLCAHCHHLIDDIYRKRKN